MDYLTDRVNTAVFQEMGVAHTQSKMDRDMDRILGKLGIDIKARSLDKKRKSVKAKKASLPRQTKFKVINFTPKKERKQSLPTFRKVSGLKTEPLVPSRNITRNQIRMNSGLTQLFDKLATLSLVEESNRAEIKKYQKKKFHSVENQRKGKERDEIRQKVIDMNEKTEQRAGVFLVDYKTRNYVYKPVFKKGIIYQTNLISKTKSLAAAKRILLSKKVNKPPTPKYRNNHRRVISLLDSARIIKHRLTS